ncbi:hypothetical protein IM40_09150 [Candidatus Paracaedimonas acanthamoebae]|nr:hypothetical protein IM40_09150 [Candidatus Paracaedimonas acanthamoebae]
MVSLLFGLTSCETTIPQNQADQQDSLSLQAEPLQEESLLSHKRKVGVLLPLSGSHAALGHFLRQATELSFFEHPTEEIELVYKDTEGAPQGALKAAQECMNENIEAIIGPVFSAEVKAIKPFLKAHQLPLLSFSNDIKMAEQGIFMFGFSPQAQVREILEYASHQNLNRIAALVPKTAYGDSLSHELKKETATRHLTLVGLIPYEGQGENLKTELDHLKHISYDALFIPVGGKELKNLFQNLDYYAFDYSHHQLLGTTLWESKEAPSQLLGSWYAAPTPETYQAFESRFEKIYGAAPQRMASLGYDAIVALSHAIKEAPTKRLSFRDFIKTDGFYGANGFFRLKEDGSVERTFFIFKWTEQGPQPVTSVL